MRAVPRPSLVLAAGRCRRGTRTRGFTLVELMIVVSIVGVLAAMAVYGVKQYMAAARSAEAKNNVGAVARSAVAAYERVRIDADSVSGAAPDEAEHALCGSSAWVPDSLAKVKGRKYQPITADNADFQLGDDNTGWRCLKFQVTQPVYYRLSYGHNAGDLSGLFGAAADYFVARAEGDTDGDGIVARFQRGGQVVNNLVTMETQVWLQNDTE